MGEPDASAWSLEEEREDVLLNGNWFQPKQEVDSRTLNQAPGGEVSDHFLLFSASSPHFPFSSFISALELKCCHLKMNAGLNPVFFLVTFGQVKSQEAGEAHHGDTGVEVRRGVTEELVHV